LFGIGVDRHVPARTRCSGTGANRTDQTLRPPAFVAAAGSCLPFVGTSCLDLIDIPIGLVSGRCQAARDTGKNRSAAPPEQIVVEK
jgi:hypothetical protein